MIQELIAPPVDSIYLNGKKYNGNSESLAFLIACLKRIQAKAKSIDAEFANITLLKKH